MSTKNDAAASHATLNRNSLFDLTGRVALVTGGGSGIGLMAAQSLAENGARVYIVGRKGDKLDKVASIYGKNVAGEIIPLPGDVTSKEDIARLADEVASREKCLCILINNAGVAGNTLTVKSETAAEMRRNLFDASDSTFDDWSDVYRTNVAGPFFTTAAFLPLLAKSTELNKGWSGTVINIGSISGLVKGAQGHFSYNASKAAVHHLTRLLAGEIASNNHRIRINAIAPGVFPSEMSAGDSDESQKSKIPKEKFADEIPASRPGSDVDMAQTVVFLAANQYITGEVLAVDGGYTLSLGR